MSACMASWRDILLYHRRIYAVTSRKTDEHVIRFACVRAVMSLRRRVNRIPSTNGMSYHAGMDAMRNAAIVVSVNPSDFPTADALGGVAFQREIERKALR